MWVYLYPNNTETPLKNAYIGEYRPITEIWIYWSEADWVISFQTSAWNWITIADKNIWATTVWWNWNWYQWWNNYWWAYNTNPTSASTTSINASTYWPWSYYSSSTFIYHPWVAQADYTWDSSNNNNLWWEATNTYAARQWPCPSWYHVPSTADCTTLINAISSITWSVNWTKIKDYAKLPSTMALINRQSATWEVGSWTGIIKSDQYDWYRAWLLYISGSTYDNNENTPKAVGAQIRPFSNTFVQPTIGWTRLDA